MLVITVCKIAINSESKLRTEVISLGIPIPEVPSFRNLCIICNFPVSNGYGTFSEELPMQLNTRIFKNRISAASGCIIVYITN